MSMQKILDDTKYIATKYSKDSNYTAYTKEQIITKYIKNKTKKVNSIKLSINNINSRNSNKSNILEHIHKSVQTQTNRRYKTLNSERNIDKKNIIPLRSLFYLPAISPKKITISPRLHYKKSKMKIKDSNLEEIKLENYMKDRFYDEIEKKMKTKLNSTHFRKDRSIKDKIIDMNKIGIFWGGIFEYCNPILFAKKFKLAKLLSNNESNQLTEEAKSHKGKILCKAKLYTNTLCNKILWKKNKIKT